MFFKKAVVLFLILMPVLVFSADNSSSQRLILKADNAIFPYEGTFDLKIDSKDADGRETSYLLQVYKKKQNRQTVVWAAPKQNLNDVGMMVNDVIYYKPFKTSRAMLMSYKSVFMSTGLSWGDVLKSMIAYDYTAKSISEKSEGGTKYLLLRLQPKKRGLYARIDVWINKANNTYYKREYYSAMGDKIKEAIYSDYKFKHGRITGYTVSMDNYDEETKSVAVISNIKNKKLHSFLFDPQNIGKIHIR